MLRLTHILSVFVLLFTSQLAMARWHESIGVVGGDPGVMQGATVTFTQPGGTAVPGEVEEEDDGDPTLVFDLPGDGPSAGTVTIDYADGTSASYAVPQREAGTPLVLNLDTGMIATTGGAVSGGMSEEGRFAFGAGIGFGLFYSDHLDETAGRSAAELSGVFADNGVTSASTGSSNDDDAYGVGFNLSGRFAVSDQGDLVLRGGWAETNDYDGRSFGTGLQGGLPVNADASITSEVELYTLSAGYEHIIDNYWGISAELGYTWAEEDLSFRSGITVDGLSVSATAGSEKNSEDSWTASAGIQRYLKKHSRKLDLDYNIAVGARVSYTDELLNDEEMVRVEIWVEALTSYF